MSDVINLNKARKTKLREKKEQTASENRAKFGRTKEERTFEAMKETKRRQHIDAHKREGASAPQED